MCYNNQLTSLDVSANTGLTTLRCDKNQITTLDVSQNTGLTYFVPRDNPLLECINVKNGTNTGLNFNAVLCPKLTCIEVDNVGWSSMYWSQIDPGVSFSEDCYNACAIVGLNQLSAIPLELVKITDLLGRAVPYKPNTLLIYIYSDGSIEKVFRTEY